jgi:hypothetical protein
MAYLWLTILVVTAWVYPEEISGASSGFPSGSNPLPCTLVIPNNPCRNLSKRGTLYTLPLSPAVGADIDDEVTRIGFSIAESMRGRAPDACLDFVEYFICLLGTPPCDPESGGWPLLICDSDCLAFNKLRSQDTCDTTIDFVYNLAKTTLNQDFLRALELFKMFDCNNVSTYDFYKLDCYAECTGLLSEESKDEVLNGARQFQCVPEPVSSCAHVFNQPYYIPLPDREENETFAIINSISDQMDNFCGKALTALACQFINPPCDPEKVRRLQCAQIVAMRWTSSMIGATCS